MKRKYLIELVIAVLLVITEIIVIAVTYSEALNAKSTDVYMTAILAIFLNIDILYGLFISIFNCDWRKK